jgi:hypothetical protein
MAGVPPHAKGPLSESAKKIMEMMEPIQEGNGYIRVELFCQQHLERLHQFVSESFDEVLTLKFQSYEGVVASSPCSQVIEKSRLR